MHSVDGKRVMNIGPAVTTVVRLPVKKRRLFDKDLRSSMSRGYDHAMPHVTWHRLVLTGCSVIAASALFATATHSGAAAEPQSSVEAWRSSPFHGAISGATGTAIPCLCRFSGRSFKLGERVCMQTPNGVLIVRCDMHLNNTTWVPTEESCVISRWQSTPERRHS